MNAYRTGIMNTDQIRPWITGGLAVAGPVLLYLFGCLPISRLLPNGVRVTRLGARLAWASCITALLAGVSLVGVGTVEIQKQLWGAFSVGIYFDTLSALVLALVSFLLAIVFQFSVHSLAGDPGQGRFARWLALTGGSVLSLVISGNLVQFTLAWCATSLCLHQLLVFYPDRPGAVLAARKKFLISRLGDTCLWISVVLVLTTVGTSDFSVLFREANAWHGANPLERELPVAIQATCFLLVLGAMLKSAQFPFHSWLPDTMETPTPVSALMHAGIINAGGFLILRLHPVLTLSPGALALLACVGAFTALFGSLVMMTHASVKRALAFSTVAQMGFMMLECGLGAFHLAVLHLMAHSLYKAYAFLSSGSIVSLAKAAWTPKEKPSAHPILLMLSVVAAAGLAGLGALIIGVHRHGDPGQWVLVIAFAMGLTFALWNLWSRSASWITLSIGALSAVGLTVVFFALHEVFGRLLGPIHWINEPMTSWPGILMWIGVLVLFFVVLLLQTELPQWSQRPSIQALYVHARNGFYFNTLANRILATLWPLKPRNPKG